MKKFSLMNQAMLAKQYWRINQNSQSFISKTFKPKYFPRSSIHGCLPKPHRPWFWRNIIDHKNIKLKDGRWLIGIGSKIPLNHSVRFPCQAQHLNNPNLSTGSMADLIDSNLRSWKPNLVRSLYPFHLSSEILRLPISKIGIASDRLLWKHSYSGDFQVKNTYNLLHSDNSSSPPNPNRHLNIPLEVWCLIWNAIVPLKIYNFVWRLLHDSLPTNLTLKEKRDPNSQHLPSL